MDRASGEGLHNPLRATQSRSDAGHVVVTREIGRYRANGHLVVDTTRVSKVSTKIVRYCLVLSGRSKTQTLCRHAGQCVISIHKFAFNASHAAVEAHCPSSFGPTNFPCK